jgi:hypothetical protein
MPTKYSLFFKVQLDSYANVMRLEVPLDALQEKNWLTVCLLATVH